MAEPQHSYDFTCPQCGKHHRRQVAGPRGQERRYCDKACRKLARSAVAQRRYANPKHPSCVRGICGETYQPKAADRITCCSRECGFEYRRQTQRELKRLRPPTPPEPKRSSVCFPVCASCDVVFAAHHPRKHCSAICRKTDANEKYRAKYAAEVDRDLGPRPCGVCNKIFVPGVGNKQRFKFCSERCQKKNNRHHRTHKDRAEWHGVEWEPIGTYAVFDRDCWTCQVCGEKTPERLRGSYRDRAPELDHRIPMVMGGGHVWGNVQCACRKCNAEKGGTKIVGQMPLFIQP